MAAAQQQEPIGILPSFHHPHHHHHHHHPTNRWSGSATPTITEPPGPPPPPFSAAARLGGGGSGGARAAVRRMRNEISEDEKQEIRMAFELFDTRKTGKLSYREVKVAMRALDFDVKKPEVKRLIDEHARSDAEEVDLEEFMEIMMSKYRERDPDEEIAKAFRCFDEDGTGRISLKNLRKIARDVGEHITDEELAAMIDEFDKDGDGEINETEFFSIMKKDEMED